MSCISAIYSHVYHCSYVMAFLIGNTELFHQLCISHSYRNTVNLCDHTVSTDLFNICNTVSVNRFAICFLQTLADRMGRRTLCKCCILQQFLIRYLAMMNTAYFKHTLGHGTCFIKYHIFGLCQCFQIVGAFDKHSLVAGTTDSCKKA